MAFFLVVVVVDPLGGVGVGFWPLNGQNQQPSANGQLANLRGGPEVCL